MLAATLLAACSLAAQEPPAQGGPDPLFGAGRGLELTFEGALELALQNNLGLAIESLATDSAMHSARGSWGAFDWLLASNLGATDAEFESTNVFTGSSTDTHSLGLDLTRPLTTGGAFHAHVDTLHTHTNSQFAALPSSSTDVVSLSYVQPLLRGAWRQYATSQQRIADLDWRRQVEHEREVRQSLLANVGIAYWDLVAAREQLDVARSALSLAKAQVDQDRRRLEAGVGTELDVLSAQAQVATREELHLAAETRVRAASDVLRQLLFHGTDRDVWETQLVPSSVLPEQVDAATAPSWTAALAIAIDGRPELAQQRLAIQASEVRHEERVVEKRPFLDLALTASSVGFDASAQDAFEEAVRYDFPTWQAALAFSFPLTNTSAREAESAAWSSLRAARLAYDQIETRIAGEVREAVRQIVYFAQAAQAAKTSLDLARRQLDAEQKRRESGTVTNFQVLQFQDDLDRALVVERTARVNYVKAQVALLAAQGLLGAELGR